MRCVSISQPTHGSYTKTRNRPHLFRNRHRHARPPVAAVLPLSASGLSLRIPGGHGAGRARI